MIASLALELLLTVLRQDATLPRGSGVGSEELDDQKYGRSFNSSVA